MGQLPLTGLHPSPPWRLRGSLLLSVFAVPAAELPAEGVAHVPPGRRPLTAGGRAIVGVAFARYEPGGDLAYDELLVAAGTTALLPAVTQIWVDSAASRAGGRALWGIPKEMATFGGDAGIARLRARAGSRSMRLPLPVPTYQHLDGTTYLAGNLVTADVRPMRASWEFAADGPLRWLHGRRPLTSVALTGASITFGIASRRTRPDAR